MKSQENIEVLGFIHPICQQCMSIYSNFVELFLCWPKLQKNNFKSTNVAFAARLQEINGVKNCVGLQ